MPQYKGKDVIVLQELPHDDNDYAVIHITNPKNGETSTDRVKAKDIKPGHTEQLSAHVPIAVVADAFHPKFIDKRNTK
jgi:hypothetical protein